MIYFTLLNKASEPTRVFAATGDRAKEIAVAAGRAHRVENLRIRQAIEVDPVLFPHEGTASLQLGGVYQAFLRGRDEPGHAKQQLSGDLKARAS